MANRLQALRKKKGLTQVRLAQEAHVCRTVIARHETGRNSMSTRNLTKIAKVLGVTVDQIIGGKSDGAAG